MSLLDILNKSKVIPEVNITSLNTELDRSRKLLKGLQNAKKALLKSFVHIQTTRKKVQDKELQLKELNLNFDNFVEHMTDKPMSKIIHDHCAEIKNFSDSINIHNTYAHEYNTNPAFLLLKDHSLIENITFDKKYLEFFNGTKINNYNISGNITTLLNQDCLGDAI